MNISTFIAELMQRKEVTTLKEAISPKVERKLKSNRVLVNLPALYGSSFMRGWGLKTLGELAKKYKDQKFE